MTTPIPTDYEALRKWAKDAAQGKTDKVPYIDITDLLNDHAALRAEVERLGRDGAIGAILTYDTKGHNKPCGQTCGANGAGEFAIVFHGTPDEADAAAREHIRALEMAGHRFNNVTLVRDEEVYTGQAIRHINAAIEAEKGKGNA